MNFNELDVKEFQKAVTDQRLMQLKIVIGALVFGPVLFGIVAGIMAKAAKEIELLSYINYGLAVLAFFASLITPLILLRKAKPVGSSVEDLANQMLDKIQSVTIIRFAIAEGAALFGGVCIYIGLGYLHYLSFLPLFINVLFFFPTKRKVLKIFIVNVLKDERLLAEYSEL